MDDELKEIKRIYGEEMMHLCRDLFPTILETPGTLLKILTNNIAPTHMFAKDIINHAYEDEFKSFVYHFFRADRREQIDTNKTPNELLEEAGYDLYECKSEKDIQSFKHYYDENEVICTIYRGGRLERSHVFFAVKKNAKDLKREDFKEPRREDEYGTSVISIQFSRGYTNTLSIKNRYNHTVDNPDSTFHNNLENIIPGLTKSFEKRYGFHIESQTDEDANFLVSDLHYVQSRDGKYYRYNVEVDGIYYCENNIIIKDGEVIDAFTTDKGRFIFADQYLIDTKEKVIIPFIKNLNSTFDPIWDIKIIDKVIVNDDGTLSIEHDNGDEKKKKKEDSSLEEVNKERKTVIVKMDSFAKSIYDVGKIKNITVSKEGENKIINIRYTNDELVKIKINSNNDIIGYENKYAIELAPYFLSSNRNLKEFKVDNVKIIREGGLLNNMGLEELNLPNVEVVEKGFMESNRDLSKFEAPNLKYMGDRSLYSNRKLEIFFFPSLEEIDKKVMYDNTTANIITLPRVKKIGDYFFANHMDDIKMINMRHVKNIGHGVFTNVAAVEEPMELMDVERIGYNFLAEENYMKAIYMPNVDTIQDNFMARTTSLEEFYAPKLKIFSIAGSLASLPNMRNKITDCILEKRPCEVVQPNKRM